MKYEVALNPIMIAHGGGVDMVEEGRLIEVDAHTVTISHGSDGDYIILKDKGGSVTFKAQARDVRYCRVIENIKGILISAVDKSVASNGGEQ